MQMASYRFTFLYSLCVLVSPSSGPVLLYLLFADVILLLLEIVITFCDEFIAAPSKEALEKFKKKLLLLLAENIKKLKRFRTDRHS